MSSCFCPRALDLPRIFNGFHEWPVVLQIQDSNVFSVKNLVILLAYGKEILLINVPVIQLFDTKCNFLNNNNDNNKNKIDMHLALGQKLFCHEYFHDMNWVEKLYFTILIIKST